MAVSTECTTKSLDSDVTLEHILINKKAAEVSKIYLGRHVYMYLLIYRSDLFDYAELFAHLDECVDCAVEVFTIVTCRELYTDTSLVFWYYRIVETCHVDTFFLHFCSEVL